MKKIFILSLISSNYKSVVAACKTCGFENIIITPSQLSNLPSGSILIIPGVGHMSSLISEISRDSSIENIREIIYSKSLCVLGICLGFQFLFRSSDEHLSGECLNLFPHHITSIFDPPRPSVGWKPLVFSNKIPSSSNSLLSLMEFMEDTTLYHTHSYALVANDATNSINHISYQSDGKSIVSFVCSGRFIGFQGHPEKSGSRGLKALDYALEYLLSLS